MNRSSRGKFFDSRAPAALAWLAPLLSLAALAVLLETAMALADEALADEAPADVRVADVAPAGEVFIEGDPAEVAPSAPDWTQSGGEALGKELKDTPWYDAAKDELRPVVIQPSWKLNPEGGMWGLPLLGYLLQAGAYLALTLVLLAVAWLLIRAYLNREAAEVKLSSNVHALAAADRVESLPAPVEGDLHDLLAVARRLAAEGKYSEAIVYLYSHELVELDRHRHIRLSKGKTNRQYLRELAGESDLRSLLATTMDRFERAFFGAERLDQASFDACLNEISRFSTLVIQEPA